MLTQEIASMSSLAMSLSAVLDMANPEFANHHQRVAFIAYQLGLELNLPFLERKDILLAGAFHDIGVVVPKERIAALGGDPLLSDLRAEIGYRLLRDFEPFAAAAEIIRHRGIPWVDGRGKTSGGSPVSFDSHIIYLADRVAMLIPDQMSVLGRSTAITEEIRRESGSRFHPDAVEALVSLSQKEFFWLDAASSAPMETLKPIIELDPIELDFDTLIDLGQLFSRIIDFRSHFTASHSAGVSATAGGLAQFAGFSMEECFLMRLAGFLHDLGKLAVSAEIIEKPGRLSPEESDIMRTHTYFGFRTLQKAPSLHTVNLWGSLHHERLDGSGYPFHLTRADLPLGSRIMAVADVFTALSEKRPYREGMSSEAAMAIIRRMADDGALDADIATLLDSHLAEIDGQRNETMRLTLEQYNSFFADIASDLSAGLICT
jgi:HD-GYP domain-containing protein (c-di-GMP phosphodiesterase class II)